MSFTKQGNFTKKVTDLPDRPSPTYTANDMKAHFQTPADELKTTLNSLVDGLNADTGASNIGAKKDDGATGTIQSVLDEKATKERVDSIIASAGDSNTEIVDARGGYTVLRDRLQSVDEQLAEKPNQVKTLKQQKTRYIAHRGLTNLAPENTLAAYTLASKYGYWGAGCDVWCTADGEWVLMHDQTVDRMTNGTGSVVDLTLAYIKSLIIDAGNRVAYYPNQKVPTLEEYLLNCKELNLVPVIEIKTTSYETVYTDEQYRKFVDVIRKCGMEENVFVEGSEPNLTKLRLQSKTLPVHLFNVPNGLDTWVDGYLKSIGNAVLSTDKAYVTKESVQKVHDFGYPISTFTVNDAIQAKQFEAWGVDFLTTDILLPSGGAK